MEALKTDYQKEKEARELKIYNEYVELNKSGNNAKTAVNKQLMKKYGLHAMSTVYAIVYRVQKRLAPSN